MASHSPVVRTAASLESKWRSLPVAARSVIWVQAGHSRARSRNAVGGGYLNQVLFHRYAIGEELLGRSRAVHARRPRLYCQSDLCRLDRMRLARTR
jgi:hypothetical protein